MYVRLICDIRASPYRLENIGACESRDGDELDFFLDGIAARLVQEGLQLLDQQQIEIGK
jgi:hypothetical protein